jgi:ribosomal protein S21
MIQVEVTRSGNENSLSVLRKFTRRVQGTGIVREMRNRRYRDRALSKTVQKKQALKRLKRRAHYEQMLKEGKITETTRPTGRGRGRR